MDSIYTPTELAETMVRHAGRNPHAVIADFAVGGGELLRAAATRWPAAKLFGLDLNTRAVLRLTKSHPTWVLACCNFLSSKSRDRSPRLRAIKGKVSLALLNPPFSHRGWHRCSATLNGCSTNCSQGLAFVVTALSYMASRAEVLAILPAGTLHSEMDQSAWALIDLHCQRQVLGTNGDRTFPGRLPKTVIVKLRLGTRRKNPPPHPTTNRYPEPRRHPKFNVIIERGKVDMPSLNLAPVRSAVPLVHSTELDECCADLTRRRTGSDKASLDHHAVLIPRVGRPNRLKVCLCPRNGPIALSNCVIAMKCRTKNDAITLHKTLLRNWPTLKGIYTGTCAQYITLKRLRTFLHTLGFGTDSQMPPLTPPE
jgi:hypothetical protein